MKGFITLTHVNKPLLVAVHSIGVVRPEKDRANKPFSVLSLSLGHKVDYAVSETFEEVVRLIEEAQ